MILLLKTVHLRWVQERDVYVKKAFSGFCRRKHVYMLIKLYFILLGEINKHSIIDHINLVNLVDY